MLLLSSAEWPTAVHAFSNSLHVLEHTMATNNKQNVRGLSCTQDVSCVCALDGSEKPNCGTGEQLILLNDFPGNVQCCCVY